MNQEVALVVSAVFLATVVESVEALTIVLAVGLTNGWRTALLGTGLALVALAVVIIALGPALVRIIPIGDLQVLIGTLLLIFGLQWLRKAILRASGLKALHDEAKIFREELAALNEAVHTPSRNDIDWTGFVVSFKGVFLEGLEVAFIVLTIAAKRQDSLGASALGAVLAVVLVSLVGAAVHKPLTRVPENAIKFTVGLMLVAFGTFWGGEGIGVEWSLGDWTILVLTATYTLIAWAAVTILRRNAARPQSALAGSGGAA